MYIVPVLNLVTGQALEIVLISLLPEPFRGGATRTGVREPWLGGTLMKFFHDIGFIWLFLLIFESGGRHSNKFFPGTTNPSNGSAYYSNVYSDWMIPNWAPAAISVPHHISGMIAHPNSQPN